MIDRDVEKALNLLSVQVERQYPVCTSRDEQIGDEFSGDGNSRLIFAILPGISKIWNNCRDPIGARTSGCINQNEELHQILIRGRAGRLHNVNVAPPNIFINFDPRFAIRKGTDHGLAEGSMHPLANSQSEIAVSRS